jgi:hypothetical protein
MTVLCSKHKGGAILVGTRLSYSATNSSSSTQLTPPAFSEFCFHTLRSVQFSLWFSSFATIVTVCAHAFADAHDCLFVRADCVYAWCGRAAVPVYQFSFSPNHDMPQGLPPPPPPIIICRNLQPSLCISLMRARVCVNGDFSLGFTWATAVLFYCVFLLSQLHFSLHPLSETHCASKTFELTHARHATPPEL